MLQPLRAASSRAIIIAKTIFQALHVGLNGAQTLTLSLGIGIFANNALTAMLILLSPIPILLAKPFSDKHLSKLYYECGIWLFKPIGWTTYRILSLIPPSYTLGLQFYLIGGAFPLHGLDVAALTFLAVEIAAVSFSCILALLPGLSRNPLQCLGKYARTLKLVMPAILAFLLAVAISSSINYSYQPADGEMRGIWLNMSRDAVAGEWGFMGSLRSCGGKSLRSFES
jgi:hypothetical protein